MPERRVHLAACWLVSALLVTAGAACTTDDPELGADEAELTGATNFAPTCPADVRRYVEDTMLHARIATGSTAFAQCVDRAMRTGVNSAGRVRSLSRLDRVTRSSAACTATDNGWTGGGSLGP